MRFLALFLLAFLFGMGDSAQAAGWQASLHSEGLPKHLVAVDKSRKSFFFFEKKSPLKLKHSFVCVTGQLEGDKQVVNDLRTPEGIYFVEYKIAAGLDFKEYGGLAYTLNYPNPVDRLRGKTGHGIWIHSKGFELAPTRGCVAIGLKEIEMVGPQLTPGTAVVLAEELDETKAPQVDGGTARELRRQMQNWSAAWASRSRKMFEFYDASAYTKAMSEPFAAFRQNKERLFGMLQFIKIFNREIHVLEGPGYWVTWSEQLYTASNLSTEGIRRLYWQRGADKKFRIVGMEWTPRDVGMRADFQKGRLVAESRLTLTDVGSEAPVLPRLDMPEAPVPPVPPVADVEAVAELTPDAVASAEPVLVCDVPLERAPAEAASTAAAVPAETASGNTASGNTASGEKLVAAGEALVPRRSAATPPAEIQWGSGQRLDSMQPREGSGEPSAMQPTAQDDIQATTEAATRAESTPVPEEMPEAAPASAPVSAPVTAPEQGNLTLSPEVQAELLQAVRNWNSAFAARSPNIAELYDQARYNRMPTVSRGFSYTSVQRELAQQFRAPWLNLISREPAFEVMGPVAVSRSEQLVVSPGNAIQGVRTLYWARGADNVFSIVGSEFKPAELGLAADYLDEVSGEVSAVLESWRKAWEAGRLDEYMSYYTDDAVQQGRGNARNIRRQKELLWSKVKPALVQLAGLRLVMDKRGIRADMNQVYADSAGKSDRGTKTLQLRYDGENWRIQREDWSAMTPSAAQVRPARGTE